MSLVYTMLTGEIRQLQAERRALSAAVIYGELIEMVPSLKTTLYIITLRETMLATRIRMQGLLIQWEYEGSLEGLQ